MLLVADRYQLKLRHKILRQGNES